MTSPSNLYSKLSSEDIADFSQIDLQQEVKREKNFQEKINDLKSRLSACEKGNPGSTKFYPNMFEDICFDMLNLGLHNEITDLKLKSQVKKRSAHGNIIEVTDIELQNNGRTEGTFWHTMYCDYGSQRIVFECKNLNVPIDEEHIFQLYMYLGKTGRYGVILSRNDCNEYDTRKKGLTHQAFKAIHRLYQDASFMIWIWGEAEIISFLDHCESKTVRQFFLDQNSLFLATFR